MFYFLLCIISAIGYFFFLTAFEEEPDALENMSIITAEEFKSFSLAGTRSVMDDPEIVAISMQSRVFAASPLERWRLAL